MRKGVYLFLLFFTVGNLHAQNNTSASTKDSEAAVSILTSSNNDIFYLKETEFDFGKIQQGKPVTHIFTVLNNGKDSLKIINVQASCGCTTPSWEKNKVQAPGEKTAIVVGFNAAGEGVFNKSILVNYNGTQTKQLIIKGEVWGAPLTSAPENKALENLKNL